jgi:hypothetical protein
MSLAGFIAGEERQRISARMRELAEGYDNVMIQLRRFDAAACAHAEAPARASGREIAARSRAKTSAPPRKFLADPSLSARQIRVVASDGTPDRDGDVMDPQGCDFSAYRSNPVVLAAHNPMQPNGTAALTRTPTAIEATITFAPPGASRVADEFCALAKAGVLSAFSVGFRPIEARPRGNGLFCSRRGSFWKFRSCPFVEPVRRCHGARHTPRRGGRDEGRAGPCGRARRRA